MRKVAIVIAGIVLSVGVVRAQVGTTPFFFPGSVGYEPTISTVATGPFLAQQTIISADRKYVTISANYSDTALVTLVPYTFVSLPSGFVGEATPAVAGNAKKAVGGVVGANVGARNPTILDQKGMTFIASLNQ